MNARKERVLAAIGRGFPIGGHPQPGSISRISSASCQGGPILRDGYRRQCLSAGLVLPRSGSVAHGHGDGARLGGVYHGPMQAAAQGMEPELLKERFGKRICLYGGIDTQFLLPYGSPAAVRREVRRRLDILGAGGGYILAPCHVIQTDVPTANVLAMVETATAA